MWFLSNANVMTWYGQPMGHFDYVFSCQIKIGSWMVCIHKSVFVWVPVSLSGKCWRECNYWQKRTQGRKCRRDKIKNIFSTMYVTGLVYWIKRRHSLLHQHYNQSLKTFSSITIGIFPVLLCRNWFLKGHENLYILTFCNHNTKWQSIDSTEVISCKLHWCKPSTSQIAFTCNELRCYNLVLLMHTDIATKHESITWV